MKIDKRIKEMPWPEAYHGGQENFAVTLSWPIVDHERLLVATFMRNREKRTYNNGPDFRLVCSKKDNTASILSAGNRIGKRKSLDDALRTWSTSVACCYPKISEQDEIALAKWLRRRGTDNHLMPELNAWIEQAQEAETLAERDARGELRDEDVNLCPNDLPDGLLEYIRREVLPTDDVLIYKKGNVRGTCYRCGEKVRAVYPQRFKHCGTTRCPSCGRKVRCYLETSDSFKVDYVEDIATIQKGTDGITMFVRQWHLCRDPSAAWENVPAQLEEVARYAVRGNRAAKWQREAKETWYYKSTRYKLNDWERVKSVTSVYDGQYFFYMPQNWQQHLQGTSLQYCDLEGYATDAQRNGIDRNTIRFLMDWGRYPAVEKLWKAGYCGLIHEHIRGVSKELRHDIIWTKDKIQDAVRFPPRLLKIAPPSDWDMSKMNRTKQAWEMSQAGRIRETEIAELVSIPCPIDYLQQAIGHASIHKIAAYIEKITAKERKERAKQKAKAEAEGRYYYSGRHFFAPQMYRDYLRECQQLNLNMDDSAVLFPKNLDAAHQRTMAQVKYKISEEKKAAYAAAIAERQKLEWQQDDLLIRLPTTPDELVAEGDALHHCVGGYVDSMVEGTTTILFIRDTSEPNKPFYTLEWRDGRVAQCRTTHNKSYTQDERVSAFVDAWVRHVTKKTKKKTKATAAA